MSGFKVRWQVLVPLIALHLGAVAAPFYFDRSAVALAFLLWIFTGLFGITVGYHRLLSHRSFETYKWVKYFHILAASISLQQGPISWVRLHRAHHAHSDTDSDPHPQHFGFWFGHIGWTFLSHSKIGRSEAIRKIPVDISSDPVMVFFERFHLLIFLVSMILLYAIGGMEYLLWAGCFRTVVVLHATWSVNSLGHRLGYRNFTSVAPSTNNPIVAAITFGEGWHNNHHRYPASARQGLTWYEIDLSWVWILLLKKCGLAWDIREAHFRGTQSRSRRSGIPRIIRSRRLARKIKYDRFKIN